MTTVLRPALAASRAAEAPAMPHPMTRTSARMSRSLMAPSTHEVQADVDRLGRVGQGPDGDEIDAGLGDGSGAGAGRGAGRAGAGGVVLEEDHLGQAGAVVRPAGRAHGVFFEEAQPGGRLARVEDTR